MGIYVTDTAENVRGFAATTWSFANTRDCSMEFEQKRICDRWIARQIPGTRPFRFVRKRADAVELCG